MLVLAVLVAVAAIVIPNLGTNYEGYRLKKAGEQVRVAWNRARVQAMRSGRIHVFRCETGTNQYVIQPVMGIDDYLESGGLSDQWGAAGTYGDVSDAAGTIQMQSLDERVAFVNVAARIDLRSARVLNQIQQVGGALGGGMGGGMGGAMSSQVMGGQGQASSPILFYPDGTSSTAQLLLTNQQEQFVVLQLRGVTGLAAVSDLLSVDEVQQ